MMGMGGIEGLINGEMGEMVLGRRRNEWTKLCGLVDGVGRSGRH